jgi:hypothetical protein
VQAEATALDTERQATNEEMAKLVKGQETVEPRTMPKKEHDRYQVLKDQARTQREQVDALRGLLAALEDRLAGLRRKDSLLWLLQSLLPERKQPLQIKLAAARAIGAGAGDVTEALGIALVRLKETEDLLALLEAFAIAGKSVQPYADHVVQLMQHKEEAVRERAAAALAKIAVPEAIAPMIDLLDKSGGQTRLRVVTALEVLTGQQLGDNPGAWKQWFASEGKDYLAGTKALGEGKPSKKTGKDASYYFGIPQHQSSSILYAIDCSGSMKQLIDFTPPGGTAAGAASKATRLDACKKELIAALGRLRPDQKFALLWYNDLPHLWEPKTQAATPEAVKRAQAFVETLQPASSTNIYDSLQQAFGLVGRGSRDKYYGVELDSIFLLTDGSPTTTDGKLDSTDKILAGVREWNPLKRVTLHCIAIGKGLNLGFLQQLARENGGECKQF